MSKNRGCGARRGPGSVQFGQKHRWGTSGDVSRVAPPHTRVLVARNHTFWRNLPPASSTPAVRQTIESFKREWRKWQNLETPDRCPIDSGDLRWARGSLPRVLGSPGGNKKKYLGDFRFSRFFSKKMGLENLKIRQNAYLAPFP